jgi:prevent-host-death family protein
MPRCTDGQADSQRFSELVRHARADGPQVVTRHGEEVAALPSFKDFLLAAPDLDVLDIERSRERARVVELTRPAGDTP